MWGFRNRGRFNPGRVAPGFLRTRTALCVAWRERPCGDPKTWPCRADLTREAVVQHEGGPMKFAIKHRWTGSVLFEADIEATEGTPESVKLGLAVKIAVKARANLSRANLFGANLFGADLSGANLSGADL